MLTLLNNWSLSKKMLVAFALIGALLALLATIGTVANRQMASIAERHVVRGVGGMDALSTILGQVREQRILVYSQAGATGPAEIASLEDRFDKTKTVLAGALAEYEKVAGEEFAADAAKLRQSTGALTSVNARILAARHTAPATGLGLIGGEGKDAARDAIEAAELLQKKTLDRSAAAVDAGNGFTTKMLILTLLLSLASFATLAFIWNLLAKTMSQPMAELAAVTTRLAEGNPAPVPHRDRTDELGAIAKAVERFRASAATRADTDSDETESQRIVTTSLGQALVALTAGDLTVAITEEYPAHYAALKTDFNAAVASLRALIGGVTESTDGIRTGSSEIAQASEDLARRTEGNAASLEETSAALVQIDSRLKATALSSSQTVSRADQAIATVGGGRATAEEAVQAMGRVSDSAKGIDSVIEGLDKIAFQTRVLAMNAAVEAGRAGDAGRGFAVVADLVSALAMRAEEEAKRARDQLTLTQTDIVTAVQAVQKVDGALANISNDVGEVHKLLGTMADDATAQSSAITQITSAISAMDQATQQNAAMVEETSAAARNLTTEVTALADQAAMFKVEDAPARRAPAERAYAERSVARAPVKAPKKAASAYRSPVKALPVMAGASSDGDDWNAF